MKGLITHQMKPRLECWNNQVVDSVILWFNQLNRLVSSVSKTQFIDFLEKNIICKHQLYGSKL